MDTRTRQQENKYNQALGYAAGRKDATPYASSQSKRTLTTDTSAFATFYSMLEDLGGHHRTLNDAWEYFSALKLDEQKAYGTEWMRAPYSPHAMPGRHNA